jgi:hypothetical protein
MSGPARRNRKQERFDLWREYSVANFNVALEQDNLPHLDVEIRSLRDRLIMSITDQTRLFICPELEDNLTDKAFMTLLRHFRRVFKEVDLKVQWVRNPCEGGNYIPRGVIKEVHGRNGNPAGVYNPDGVSIAFHDGEDYFDTMSMAQLQSLWNKHSDARLRFMWPANFQGVGTAGSFNYPSIFDRKYIVTDQAILYSNQIMKDN